MMMHKSNNSIDIFIPRNVKKIIANETVQKITQTIEFQ